MAKIAVVAMGPSADAFMRSAEQSGNSAYLFDEVWAINGFGHVFACDRIFHMDDVRVQALRAKVGNAKIAHLLDFLKETKIPVYTSRVLPKEPNLQGIEDAKAALAVLPKANGQITPERERQERILATLEIEKELIEGGGFESLVAYPLRDVLNHFRSHPYFNNTVAYAIALAAYEGHAQTIYGADFNYPDAASIPLVEKGRGCCEYWVGMAVGRGLEVNITSSSTLLGANPPENLYGYDGHQVVGSLGSNGEVLVDLQDVPLPDGEMIERRYYKGPPAGFAQHLQNLRML